jgi:hypothetical protein
MFFRVYSAPPSLRPSIANDFEFKSLPDGNISIQFFGDDRKTINLVSVTRDCLTRFPIVAHAFLLATDKARKKRWNSLIQ